MPKILGILKDNPKTLTNIGDHLGGGVGGVPPRLLDIEALKVHKPYKNTKKYTQNIVKDGDYLYGC